MTLVVRDLGAAVNSVEARATPASAATRLNNFYRNILKRGLDIALVILTAPVWVPVVLVSALLIATDGHNPFYRQERVGLGGRKFRIWKLRTMVVDADERLEAYLMAHPSARAEWDATQKLKRDPRVTSVGRFLRKTSLDELPQLINVLVGDMSLVGPRPIMTCQTPLYHGKSYYQMRPGLTGPWQVSARNEGTFANRVKFDDTYAATMSLSTDLGLLASTVGVVVRGTGY